MRDHADFVPFQDFLIISIPHNSLCTVLNMKFDSPGVLMLSLLLAEFGEQNASIPLVTPLTYIGDHFYDKPETSQTDHVIVEHR